MAEAWFSEQGNIVSERNTQAWFNMYEQWIEFAFADLGKG